MKGVHGRPVRLEAVCKSSNEMKGRGKDENSHFISLADEPFNRGRNKKKTANKISFMFAVSMGACQGSRQRFEAPLRPP